MFILGLISIIGQYPMHRLKFNLKPTTKVNILIQVTTRHRLLVVIDIAMDDRFEGAVGIEHTGPWV